MNKSSSALLEIGIFRICLGIYLLLYNWHFVTRLDMYFGTQGMLPKYMLPKFLMVAPDFFPFPSIWFPALFFSMMILIVAFTLGWLNRWGLAVLFVLQVYFYHANPLIIHEPQPLANLFVFLFFFLPPNSSPVLIRSSQPNWSQQQIRDYESLIRIIIVFFGLYYFIVGAKKLPDPLWRDGSALKHILTWSGVARHTPLNQWIGDSLWLSRILSYSTMIFEMGFIWVVFTRWRIYLVIAGILFHLGIWMTMDVGTLSQVLIVWYGLLLDHPTRQRFRLGFSRRD